MADTKDEKDKGSEAPDDVQAVFHDSAPGKYRKCTVDGCDKRCDVYHGDNPFKYGTMACPDHGRMTVLKA